MVEAITIIAVLGFFMVLPWLSADYFKYKSKIKELEAKLDEVDKVKMIDELASMQHRLVVLEKIVTDKKYSLNEEIANLKSM